MNKSHLPENLKILASYGRSTSDICRRANINRQQFNKYVNGHSEPSLSTLRKLCDFFGIDEHEIFIDPADFRDLLRVRPPRFGVDVNPFDEALNKTFNLKTANMTLLQRHEGYYFSYSRIDEEKRFLRAVSKISRLGDNWVAKTIDRGMQGIFMLPNRVKYSGVVTETANRLMIHEKQAHGGQSLHTTFLYPAEYGEPVFLAGLQLGILAEGSQEIQCIRTVWEYIGKTPNLRDAINKCGVINMEDEILPEFVRLGIENDISNKETVFIPRY